MKQKSSRRRGLTFLKVHAFLFALFTMGMAANILVTVNNPLNADIPFSAFKMMVMQSIWVSLMWAVLFVIHLGIHQFRAARERRAQPEHLETVESIQERYVPSARLDMDTQNIDDDEIIDEEMDYAEHNGRK